MDKIFPTLANIALHNLSNVQTKSVRRIIYKIVHTP